MNKIKYFLVFLGLLGFNLVYAIDAPSNIKLDKAGEDFLEISWDKVDNAGVYAVSYGTKSGSGTGNYEHELETIVDKPKAKIENLKENTKYYIAIKAYDNDENESEYSKEVSFSTISKKQSLKLENVRVIDSRNLELEFNLNLDKNSLFDLKLTDKDKTQSFEVKNYTIKDNKVKVLLDKDLVPGKSYSLTVISITGDSGETIKNGVDSIFEFKVPLNTKKYGEQEENQEFNSAGSNVNSNSGIIDNNTTLKNITNSNNKNNTGSNLNNTNSIKQKKELKGKVLEENIKTTQKIAKENKKMPKTGPEQTALFLIFSLIAGFLFLNLRRKTNI